VKFYYLVLGLAVFVGVDAAITAHWLVFAGALAVTLYFILNPYELS